MPKFYTGPRDDTAVQADMRWATTVAAEELFYNAVNAAGRQGKQGQTTQQYGHTNTKGWRGKHRAAAAAAGGGSSSIQLGVQGVGIRKSRHSVSGRKTPDNPTTETAAKRALMNKLLSQRHFAARARGEVETGRGRGGRGSHHGTNHRRDSNGSIMMASTLNKSKRRSAPKFGEDAVFGKPRRGAAASSAKPSQAWSFKAASPVAAKARARDHTLSAGNPFSTQRGPYAPTPRTKQAMRRPKNKYSRTPRRVKPELMQPAGQSNLSRMRSTVPRPAVFAMGDTTAVVARRPPRGLDSHSVAGYEHVRAKHSSSGSASSVATSYRPHSSMVLPSRTSSSRHSSSAKSKHSRRGHSSSRTASSSSSVQSAAIARSQATRARAHQLLARRLSETSRASMPG